MLPELVKKSKLEYENDPVPVRLQDFNVKMVESEKYLGMKIVSGDTIDANIWSIKNQK